MNNLFLNDHSYQEWLVGLKRQIRAAQSKAALQVNRELLTLYWHLGQQIQEKLKVASWGDALIPQLSTDLGRAFPEMSGFSTRNVFYIRKWVSFYSQGSIVPQAAAQLPEQGNTVLGLIVEIPWGHHREIITKCKNVTEALFYIQEIINNNWSRADLLRELKGNLYQRKGSAQHNFAATLPQPQADLLRATLKSPYIFDFLTIGKEAKERDLENAMIDQIQRLLLELGQGFAFMGKQYQLKVGNNDFYIDLLFYHSRLHSYLIVELKICPFKPEFVGQLNFYLSVIDQQLKLPSDNPTIGLLLCKSSDKIVVEYALRNLKSPVGVSEYRLTKEVPNDFKGSLPSVEELMKGLQNKNNLGEK
ncbi:PDDEXK nuclease domain-containing protein [Pseudoflavitalea rhizosphaerae]|uniref:PDDEXK nuclease domain-containing protein n=1 Tax=Pseudoflavitalea rhizosphaerae TaxID=1884793 RepID=UPI000F8E46DE|nr:PDDEXK nuclease domain-containing protein [Pseudoflavitalea rhizosphaerae]